MANIILIIVGNMIFQFDVFMYPYILINIYVKCIGSYILP